MLNAKIIFSRTVIHLETEHQDQIVTAAGPRIMFRSRSCHYDIYGMPQELNSC